MLGCDGVVSVVVPAFDESERVERNLIELVDVLSGFGMPFEVILVDDGSTDATSVRAHAASVRRPDSIRVIRYDENRGKGNAVMAGAAKAIGDYVVFLDADLELHPSQLPVLFGVMQARDAHAVIGSKFHPRSRVVGYPLMRRIYSLAYYALVRLLFGLPLRDTQTGLKLFRAAALRDVLPRVAATGFAFDVELLAIAHRLGYTLADAPVEVRAERRFGRLRLRQAWQIYVETLAIHRRLGKGGLGQRRAIGRRSAA
jgi:glycosyltransferase involved in cell wall biosynthesis